MLIAVVAAIASVALGASFAFIPRIAGDLIGRGRTFALLAAITVVALHLLPESVRGLGPAAIAVLFLGVALPSWTESLADRLLSRAAQEGRAPRSARAGNRRGDLALEMSYAGLVLHHVGDGMALFAFGGAPERNLDVVIALIAHTVPVVAVFVLRFGVERGRSAALFRAALLAAALLGGCALGSLFPPAVLTHAMPWIAALVSGLLLHVITHDLEADPPRSTRMRTADLFAAALGVLLLSWASPIDESFSSLMLERVLEVGGLLLPGLILASLVSAARMHPPERPRSLAAEIGAPEASITAIPISLALLGPLLTTAWALSSVAVALSAGFGIARVAPAKEVVAQRAEPPPPEAQPFARRVAASLEELLHRIGPWTLIGVLASCYLEIGIAEAGALRFPFGDVVTTGVLAILGAHSLAGAIAPAVVLIASGASPGIALTGLLLGSKLRLGLLRILLERRGAAAPVILAAATISVSLLLLGAFVAFPTDGTGVPALTSPLAKGARTDEIAGSIVLALFVVRSAWRMGARAWIAGVAKPGALRYSL